MDATGIRWDLFIAHASEDKDSFVRPLAHDLEALGVRVWYDEFSLTIGDSLSRSIDRGLASSRFGVVVISPAFMAKPWPEYELRGLTAREVAGAKVILPIWHDVTRDEVLTFSPPLADKVALSSSGESRGLIALKIVHVVRPDLFEEIQRRAAIAKLEKTQADQAQWLPIDRILLDAPFRHDTLPEDLLIRIKTLNRLLEDVLPVPLDETVDNFRRDLHPERELIIWERIASAYLDVVGDRRAMTLDECKEVLGVLLHISTAAPLEEVLERSTMSRQDFEQVARAYASTAPRIADH